VEGSAQEQSVVGEAPNLAGCLQAERLEQIYLHDYLTGRAAGSLKVWFKPDNVRQLGGKSPGRASA